MIYLTVSSLPLISYYHLYHSRFPLYVEFHNLKLLNTTISAFNRVDNFKNWQKPLNVSIY